MKLPAPRRRGKHSALEVAAHEVRRARRSDRDAILGARRALRRAEKFYDRAVARAERDVATARAPEPIAAYGRQVVLYDDRLSTPNATHELVGAVRAGVEESPRGRGHVELTIEGPGWREVVEGGPRDEQKLRLVAEAIEGAARAAQSVKTRREPEIDAAEGRLAAARVERLGIDEVKPLLERLTELMEKGERVLDMAPGISTGHDGVLVLTDRRLLFVGLRHKLVLPYDRITSVAASGTWFRARLIVSTESGTSVVSGLDRTHATEIAKFACQRIAEAPVVV
jgi:hypothetical protein